MSKEARFLLEWLLKDDGQYGECRGLALDELMSAGLARWRKDTPRNDFGWVEITPSGAAVLRGEEVR